ncbi:MAG: RnfABCDGE type electron transport complex subunit B, partial [Salinisphaeraceae bacterium]|nr:RnfABCDGE type electron transport complex subunit B [Salinisphaeraceae bacterium]
MLGAILVLAGLAGAFGIALGYVSVRFKVEGDPLVDQIDAILPQTQCGQCSFPGCRPYAEAIAAGEAEINQCPPGGEPGVIALADLLGREPLPLNPENGVAKEEKTVAVIDEDVCIGCTKCIQA